MQIALINYFVGNLQLSKSFIKEYWLQGVQDKYNEDRKVAGADLSAAEDGEQANFQDFEKLYCSLYHNEQNWSPIRYQIKMLSVM